ncbi:MAG TPA: hypothetical protein VJP76_06845, partial [Candidatus Tumulicola sp.]|nr:hypothetical protein [Candidatus Tumulicola sp.]
GAFARLLLGGESARDGGREFAGALARLVCVGRFVQELFFERARFHEQGLGRFALLGGQLSRARNLVGGPVGCHGLFLLGIDGEFAEDAFDAILRFNLLLSALFALPLAAQTHVLGQRGEIEALIAQVRRNVEHIKTPDRST